MTRDRPTLFPSADVRSLWQRVLECAAAAVTKCQFPARSANVSTCSIEERPGMSRRIHIRTKWKREGGKVWRLARRAVQGQRTFRDGERGRDWFLKYVGISKSTEWVSGAPASSLHICTHTVFYRVTQLCLAAPGASWLWSGRTDELFSVSDSDWWQTASSPLHSSHTRYKANKTKYHFCTF